VRRYKGLDLLLSAWPRVRERRPVTLVVAGEFYEDPAPYRALAEAAGGAPHVRMLDRYLPDEEVEAVFRAADVAVRPFRPATPRGGTRRGHPPGGAGNPGGVGGLA